MFGTHGRFSVTLEFTTYETFADFCAILSGETLDTKKLKDIIARLKQSGQALERAEHADAGSTPGVPH